MLMLRTLDILRVGAAEGELFIPGRCNEDKVLKNLL